VLSEVPNDLAILWRGWMPGLAESYVPQGLTLAEGQVIVAAYQYPKAGVRACRLYRIDPATGAATGSYDLPPRCGHAGGLAYAGDGRLFVADTSLLIEVDLMRAFLPGAGEEAVVRQVALTFPLRGSFLAYRAGALWIGDYKKPGPGRIWQVPLTVVENVTGPAGLTEAHATRSLPVATASQGAGFAPDGTLWTSQSTSQEGWLQKVDPDTGDVLAKFMVAAGIEDLAFDADGFLWSVSEAGSRRWSNWSTYFPVIFRMDPTKLR
jgi:sugar lactone lactonase YvrE